MRNICMVVSYDGTSFYGFQSQPKGNTVQDEIEKAIELLTGERVKIVSSGRTDAGVHARSQVINFHTESQIPIGRWCLALNARLPRTIVIRSAEEADEHFHARRSAKRKTYRYTINNNRIPDVFARHVQFHHPTRLNVDEMRTALAVVVGEHDFTSFCNIRSTKESHVRTIYDANLTYDERSGVIVVELTGNGFLYNMVRIIVGTLLQIGEGKRSGDEMKPILQGRNRKLAGPTAPANGLMLWDVQYK